MYDGTIAANWKALITFQQLIVLSDKHGIVDITPPALAKRTGIPLDIIEEGIEYLEQPDKYSRSQEEEGRRLILLDEHRPWGWQIVNHEHYRNLSSEEDKREKNRLRKQKQRDNKECHTNKEDSNQGDKTVNKECRTLSRMSHHTIVFASVLLNNNVSTELWEEWLDIRKKKKAINSDTAIKSLVTNLEKIVEDGKYTANEAIRTAIENSWKTIKLEWMENINETNNTKVIDPAKGAI